MNTRLVLVSASFSIVLAAPVFADPPKILEFRTQEVNQKVYFHLRVARPADMAFENQDRNRRRWDPWGDMMWVDPSQRPRLVPQDSGARLVFPREALMDQMGRRFGFKDGPVKVFEEPDLPPPAKEDKNDKKEFRDKDKDGDIKEKEFKYKDFEIKEKGKGKDPREEDTALDFYGIFTGKKPVAFVLIYPKAGLEPLERKKLTLHELMQERNQWAEEKIALDPAKAKKTPTPPQGFRREEGRPVQENDLEGHWALAQSTHFALLESLTPEFGFYSFARETTHNLYKVRGPEVPRRNWLDERAGGPGGGNDIRQLYEVTTGAAAITESLALNRLRDRNRRIKDKDFNEPRNVPISEVRGVDIDEHPWVKMMGNKKPAPESLANLIPHDNYYITFKTFAKFLETGDLLDEWGTSVARAYEVNSRDYRIKQKLEQQLCLKSTGLARVFGPSVIKSMAITGNDPYLREGSDFTIIFEVTNKTVFATGAEPNIQEAKKKFKDLKEGKSAYQGVTIETFITPHREVSLHRAQIDEYAIYSNSGAAVRRIIDAHKNKIKRLADSLDFQYMRTIFRLDDPAEDGFVFLSDAFIRNLVGPAVRIKERRRLEAMTSLHMVTQGAMYTAWETGKKPQSYDHIIQTTGLQPPDLFMPDGNAVTWDNERKVAVSSVYNTQHFATPLIEIPIDNVTPSEVREYSMFRDQYMGLWRQFFDPIGIRLSMKKDTVKTEIYILPLVRTTQYNELRRVAGGGTVKIDSSMFSDKTLMKYLLHISPQGFDEFLGGGGFGRGGADLMVDLALRSWLGDWFAVRLDDSPVYEKLLESYIRSQMFPDERHDFIDDMRLMFDMPLTIGFDVRSPMIFAGLLTGVRKSMESTLPGAFKWEPMDPPYKGTTIVQIKTNGERIARGIAGPEGRQLNPTFYYALVDGAFFLSFKEEPIKDLIDHSVALKDKKGKADVADVNSSLFLGPKAAIKSKDLLRLYLEYETHRRAQTNNRLLYALFRSNVVGPEDDSPAVEAAALQYLGFVPVSPDLAPFRYDVLKEEVINLRHGSVRQPKLNKGIDAKGPMSQMLEQFATIRADLRFREDGIHTTITMKRNSAK